jgi:ABC-type transport system substrate-binding protein
MMKKSWLIRIAAAALVLIFGFSLVGAAPAEAGETQTMIIYDTPHPILSDANVRKAIAYCTDRLALISAAYPLLTTDEKTSLLMDTFIFPSSYLYNDATDKYPYNPAVGESLLNTAGWVLEPGDTYRSKDGKELQLDFYTTAAAMRVAYATLLEQQLQACGIRMVRHHIYIFDELGALYRRYFDLISFAWIEAVHPDQRTTHTCNSIPRPVNGWGWPDHQNSMGWCEPPASDAIIDAHRTPERSARISDYATAQSYFASDMVSLPLFSRPKYSVTSDGFQGFNQAPGEDIYTYRADQWSLAGHTTLHWGTADYYEPGSLWDLQQESLTRYILPLINSRAFSTLNYDLQAILLDDIPTLENGGAVNNTVSVSTGDKVVDASENIVTLETGMWIVDASGTEVEFDGTPVDMKQLVVEYEFKPNIKWSDGVNLAAEDFTLYKTVLCALPDYDTDQTCVKTQAFATTTNGYTVTYIPGMQNPLYSIPPYQWYPAHRIIQSGGPYQGWRLDQVPPEDWDTLLEVTRNPIGVGPYVLSNWNGGASMTFDANPYFVMGTPATPQIVLHFVNPDDLEGYLIDGSLDIAGPDSIGGVTQALRDADTAGAIDLTVLPSSVWEHMDINLNIFYRNYLPGIARP